MWSPVTGPNQAIHMLQIMQTLRIRRTYATLNIHYCCLCAKQIKANIAECGACVLRYMAVFDPKEHVYAPGLAVDLVVYDGFQQTNLCSCSVGTSFSGRRYGCSKLLCPLYDNAPRNLSSGERHPISSGRTAEPRRRKPLVSPAKKEVPPTNSTNGDRRGTSKRTLPGTVRLVSGG